MARRFVIKPGDKTGPHEWEVLVVDTETNFVVGSFTEGDYMYRQQQASILRNRMEEDHG